MKTALLALTLALASLRVLSAQEVLPIEKAREITQRLNDRVPRNEDAPLAVEADTDRPQALFSGDTGVMVVPDRALSPEKLVKLTGSVLPLGQLWLRNASISLNGSPLAKSHLQNVYLEKDGETISVQLYLVGLGTDASGKPELLIFGNGKEAVARMPLESIQAPPQAFPLELAGHKENEDSGILTINMLGKYSTNIRLVRPLD